MFFFDLESILNGNLIIYYIGKLLFLILLIIYLFIYMCFKIDVFFYMSIFWGNGLFLIMLMNLLFDFKIIIYIIYLFFVLNIKNKIKLFF